MPIRSLRCTPEVRVHIMSIACLFCWEAQTLYID